MKIALLGTLFLSSSLTHAADGPRHELGLNGAWQFQLVAENSATIGRGFMLSEPPTSGEWKSFTVPGYLHGTDYQRAWLRRPFSVPAEMRGQRIKICFGGVKFNSRVYVNGKHVGGRFGGYEPFEVDVTDAVRFDGPNELAVGCHDWTGVFTPGKVGFPKNANWDAERSAPRDKILSPIGGLYGLYGIWDGVTLRVHPPVYVKDLFIKPSVRRGELAVEYTVSNESGRETEVELGAVVEDQGKDVLTLPSAKVRVPAGGTAAVTLKQPWPKPPLWSHVDPHLLHLRTSLSTGDRLRTRFGFREFWVEGHKFFMNGLRVNLLATSWWPPHGWMTRDEIRKQWEAVKRMGCVAFRTHTQPWPSLHYEVADEVGLLMIPEGAVWNDDDTYRIYDPVFWKNYAKHLKAMVDRDKNRPSVVMWSLENEFLGGRLNDASPAKKDLVRMGRLMKEWDPTRPIFYESDGDPDGVADVIGIHYPHEYPDFTCWPNEAWWLEKPAAIPHMFLNGAKEFVWKKDKPLYVGEFLWIPSRDPSWHTVFFGDEAYKDYHRYRNLAKAESWKMQILGYRHLEVGGISPWTVIEGGPMDETNPLYQAHKEAYQHIAAYSLEYDWRFYFGERVPRRLVVFNDVLEPSTLDVKWTLRPRESPHVFDRGEKRLQLGAGENRVVELDLRLPRESDLDALRSERRGSVKSSWTRRSNCLLEWNIEVQRSGQPVHHATRSCEVFSHHKVEPQPGRKTPRIHLYDPKGLTRKAVESIGFATADVQSLERISPDVGLLIIGANTLRAEPAGVPVIGQVRPERKAIHDFVSRGGCLAVLHQDAYPDGLFDVQLTPHRSTMLFNLKDSLFGLSPLHRDSIKFWRGDHLVATHEPARPVFGGFVSVLVSGSAAGLDYASVLEQRLGNGCIVYSQLLSVEKLSIEPAAEESLVQVIESLIDEYASTDGYEAGRPVTCDCNLSAWKTGIIDGSQAYLHYLRHLSLQSVVQVIESLIEEYAASLGHEAGQPVALDYNSSVRRTGVIGASQAYLDYLRHLGLRFDNLTEKLGSVDLNAYGLLIFRSELAEIPRLLDFQVHGGYLYLHRIPQKSLDEFCRQATLDLAVQPYSGPISRAEGQESSYNPIAREDLYWLGKHLGIDWADTPRATNMADGVFVKSFANKKPTPYEIEDWRLEGAIVERVPPGVTFATVGSASKRIEFPEWGNYVIGLVARGTPCRGEYPLAEIKIDGKPFGTIAVNSPDWHTAATFGLVPKGEHEVSVAFVNDGSNPPKEDRNLYVDKVLIAPDRDRHAVRFFTSPPAIAEIGRGCGKVLIDLVRWDTEEQNARKAARLASTLLTEMGGDFQPRMGTTIECERMTPQPGMPFFSNQGGHAALACSGYIQTPIQVAAAGRYSMELVASGTPAAGVYPLVEVAIDGKKVGQVQLTSGVWRSHFLDLDLPAGNHELRLSFVNDFNVNGEDRNVMLDKASFYRE